MNKLHLILLSTLIIASFYLADCTLQFEISPDRQRCYVEELFKGSVMMVKWKIVGIDEPDMAKSKNYILNILETEFLDSIAIVLSHETTGQILRNNRLTTERGKLSYTSLEEGQYKTCIVYHGGWTVPYSVLMSLKINSDNMDEPNIKVAIKTQDLDPLQKKTKSILDSGRAIVLRQKSELEQEDEAAYQQIDSTKKYYYMTLVQILVVFVLGFYQLINFRKFLGANHVI